VSSYLPPAFGLGSSKVLALTTIVAVASVVSSKISGDNGGVFMIILPKGDIEDVVEKMKKTRTDAFSSMLLRGGIGVWKS
jgi:mevalonate kinase